MATATDEKAQEKNLVEDFKSSAKARLSELEPMVKEADELRAALSKVEGEGNGTPARARSRQSGQRSTRRRGRGGVDRATQFVDIVKANPGIKVSEAAKKMNLNHPNYLYRIAPKLESEGLIRRDGQGFHPGS